MIKYTLQEIIFPIFFSPGDTHIKGMLFLLHLGLEGVTEIDTDPKERFVFFDVTTSNVCAPSENSTRVQLARGRLFEELQENMQNKRGK